jgi:hypothetical protein
VEDISLKIDLKVKQSLAKPCLRDQNTVKKNAKSQKSQHYALETVWIKTSISTSKPSRDHFVSI